MYKMLGGGSSWKLSYGSWIYNYLCNQCLSPLMLWVRISIKAKCTTLCDKACQWLATGRWCFSGTPVSSTNKTDCHDISEILLKVTLNTINRTNKQNASGNWKKEGSMIILGPGLIQYEFVSSFSSPLQYRPIRTYVIIIYIW